ncbi:epoxide hydrolase family protein [Paraflavitalea sp. CAU 1676]|uniref:epoxide hydrolase family protein n=1 Tax=Paraflavitalea sp. CAU 1676 TaxID=3032598 RepID=UPI0023DC46A8|nr:epoxide hydrolase family protein [Paraflavitalea sp. CAU 1676]MDF2188512.1 epoxide hydrolase [Paraflavitalea sp. CAU 1676]
MIQSIKLLVIALFFGTLLLQGKPVHAQGAQPASIAATESIRPFKVKIPAAEIKALRQRIRDTRWPDQETVSDPSQGARLAQLKPLVAYWGRDYDWRKAEARLNALPQFTTTIDGVDIHFIHVRSKEANALPIIISHGWPGSVFELLGVIDPLANPTAHGGTAAEAFDVVIPSLPGFGFSGKPTDTGWDPDRIAKAWAVLMKRLGYHRYVAQGGDWGAAIVNAMGRQAPAELVAIHNNLPATVPAEVGKIISTGGQAPADLSAQERAVFDVLSKFYKDGSTAYNTAMTARPQAIGYGLADSPAGLAAWLLLHPGFATWRFGNDAAQTPSKDEVLDNITLYWLTNTAASSARIYWENKGKPVISAAAQKTQDIKIPVAITVFAEDIYRAPESWARRAYPNLVYFKEVAKGGHFASWEQPQLFSEEMRAAFKSYR